MDVLPIKDKIMRLWSLKESNKLFTWYSKETSLQLFNECDFARTAWFGSNWGFRMDAIIVSSSVDLVKFIVASTEVLSGFLLKMC